MTTNILYKVFPEDPASLNVYEKPGTSCLLALFNLSTVFLLLLGISWSFGAFIDQEGNVTNIWLLVAGLSSIAISVVCIFKIKKIYKNEDYHARLTKVTKEAEYYTYVLNDLLSKSNKISTQILPFYELTAKVNLDKAKIDLSENAISPFWEKIEETSKSLALFKEGVDQLCLNGEIYSKVLNGKEHNFPIPFPVGTGISPSQIVLDEYNSTIRKAQTNTGFATIWEIRRNTAVNIAGFKTLEQAINNMRDAIVAAIYNLNKSIKSEFRELKNIQIEQLKSFESSQRVIDNTLKEMDSKLYFILYNEKPFTPFDRPSL